jgi:hypothetical protein
MLAGLVALVVAGGYAAIALVAAGVVAYVVARAGPRRTLRGLERWVAPALFALAGLLSLRAATPHLAAGPQLAGLAALVALWLAATVTRPPG